jgi:hypothetical protein
VTVTVNWNVVLVVPLPGSTLPVKTVVPQENAAVGATNQGSTARSQPTAAIAAASRRRRPDESCRFVCMSGWPDRTGRPPRPALGPKGRNYRYVRTGPAARSSRRPRARRAIAPAVGAGAMLAFALSFDDLVITSFNAGAGSTTLPIYIYSSIKFGVTPQINAISTIIVAVVAVALLIGWRLGTFRSDAGRRIDDSEVEPAAA